MKRTACDAPMRTLPPFVLVGGAVVLGVTVDTEVDAGLEEVTVVEDSEGDTVFEELEELVFEVVVPDLVEAVP